MRNRLCLSNNITLYRVSSYIVSVRSRDGTVRVSVRCPSDTFQTKLTSRKQNKTELS
jgi:hypothetical protein